MCVLNQQYRCLSNQMISVEQFERSYYAEYLSDYRVGETLKRNSSTIKSISFDSVKGVRACQVC